MAINPVQFLVVPRFLAMMVMLPALTIFGIISASSAAGRSAVSRSISTPPATSCGAGKRGNLGFVFGNDQERSLRLAHHHDRVCNAGLTVEGGAEGVGQSTTTAVVQALLAMLVTNAVLTGIFFFSA